VLFLIGVFILLISILIDEGSTIILYILGYGAMETNPILTRMGFYGYILVAIIYLFIIFGWKFAIYQYQKAHKEKQRGHKLADIGVFVCCLFLVFASAGKIAVGMNTIDVINELNNPEFKNKADNVVLTINYLKTTMPEAYYLTMDKSYFSDKPFSWSMPEIYAYCIAAFMLFKVGSTIRPNGVL